MSVQMHLKLLALAALALIPNAVMSENCELETQIQYTDSVVSSVTTKQEKASNSPEFEITTERPLPAQILKLDEALFPNEERQAVCLQQDVGYSCTTVGSVRSHHYRVRSHQITVSADVNVIPQPVTFFILECH